MRSVSVSELKAHLAQHLRKVKEGERIVVTDRGRPIAELGPVPRMPEDERIAKLVRSGAIRLPKQPQTEEFWEEFWKLPRPKDPEGLVRKGLIEERDEGW